MGLISKNNATEAQWNEWDQMQSDLTDLVNRMAKNPLATSKSIRKTVEEAIEENFEVGKDNREIINQHAHCFLKGNEGPVAKAYNEAFIGNIIDAARGKS